ncbi:MAG: hypothetical protein J5750_06985 [Clostridiales bacterium]|nr:hypothetical protein [Clostridiales bacterium]
MKKLVAGLLATAMILGCVACKSEETTKKKKKAKKTTEKTEETGDPTDESTDEPTDEPTADPSADPTDDPTDDPNGDPAAPTIGEVHEPFDTVSVPDPVTFPSGLTIRHDLEKIQLGRDVLFRAYGDADPDSEFGEINYVKAKADQLYIIEDGPIQDAVSSVFDAVATNAIDLYRTRLDAFLATQQNGPLGASSSYNNRAVVFRADSEVFSCIMYETDFCEDFYDENSSCANFRYADGSTIALADVVTDMDALVMHVSDDMDPENYFYTDTIEALKDGSVTWALLYDGIYILHYGKVPVIGNEDMFDLSSFGATPETYSIQADHNNEIIWDVDEDGYLDDIRITANIDDQTESVERLVISVNSDQYVYTDNEIIDLSLDCGFASDRLENYLIRTDYGFFLVVALESYFWDHTCIFRIDQDGVMLLFTGEFSIVDACDPDNVLVSDVAYITGLEGTRESCRISDIGYPAANTIFKDVYSGPYKTKIDLPANETNLLTMEIGDEVTVPAGTMVAPIYYVEGAGLLVMRILDPDDSKTSYVVMETDGEFGVAGYHAYEGFYGVMFGE